MILDQKYITNEIAKIKEELETCNLKYSFRTMESSPINIRYYFLEGVVKVETDFALKSEIRAWFCDDFDYTSQIAQNEMNGLLAMNLIEYIISRSNVIFLEPFYTWCEKEQNELFRFIKSNYGVFPLKLFGLAFHEKGYFVKRGKSLRMSFLDKEVELDRLQLARLVKGRREALGFTKLELSKKAGISVRTIYDIEKGLRVSPRSAYILSNYLGYDISEVTF